MPDIAIRVEHLSKRYQIGTAQPQHDTLRDQIVYSLQGWRRRNGHANGSADTIWALKDISFEVKKGEALGIIGRNGAGKSTLLKILSRITEPTMGRASLYGRVASLLEVGTGFHPELSGRENIFLNGAMLGMSRQEIQRKFDEIVAFSEVEKFLDTPVKRYSSGMYVRLAFAVAAHLEPEILVVDEVLAVGDAAFQKKCLGKMGSVAQEGRTVLFVSHNMSFIQQLCSQALLISDGSILQDGDTARVVATYLATVAEKVGASVDLALTPRAGGTSGNIQFMKCSVIDSTGEANARLKYGEPLTVQFEAISTSKYEELSLVVGIDSASGVRILTSVSDESSVVYFAFPGQPLRAKVRFDSLVLTPGLYQLSISIRSGKIALDTLMHVLSFEVSVLVTNDRLPHSGTRGLVSIPAQWN